MSEGNEEETTAKDDGFERATSDPGEQQKTRRVETLPHLLAKARRPDAPAPQHAEEQTLEEDTFNPEQELFENVDDDFLDGLFDKAPSEG